MRLFFHTLLLMPSLVLSPVMAAEKTDAVVLKTEQAAKEIASGIQLLDVRTPEEWNEGHIRGAKLVTYPADDLAAKAAKAVDPQKPVLVYCRSGARSAKAAKLLRDAGFKDVREMAGGTLAWEKEGRPLVKPEATKAR
ncbi:MAG: rhodanese-like domain-containing protein [Verrucomicrobiaceae bacterium]|nr:MAG: rhodanese-like domain-containing protein [Verrucomicrobiaceae bacterium]